MYGLVWHGRIAVAVKTSKVADDPISEKEIMVLRKVRLSQTFFRMTSQLKMCRIFVFGKIGQYRGEARLTLPDPKTGEEQAERLFVFMKYIHGHDFERTEGYRTKVQAFSKSRPSRLAKNRFMTLQHRSGYLLNELYCEVPRRL